MPSDLKARTDAEGEASLRGHLKAEGIEESGSQSYVPTDEKDDRALKEAFDLLRGTITDAAFPPDPKAAVPKQRGTILITMNDRAKGVRYAKDD